MMKKLILALIQAILPVMVSTTQAQDIVDSGTCDDNLTWTLTELDDGNEWSTVYQLTISGNGDMADNTYYDLPWYSYRKNIEKIIIEYGVTRIGNSAFYNCNGLKEVIIPSSVTSIGRRAFEDCYSLKEVEIPNSVTTIGESAFESCGLTSIVIPNSVKSIDSHAFAYCI